MTWVGLICLVVGEREEKREGKRQRDGYSREGYWPAATVGDWPPPPTWRNFHTAIPSSLNCPRATLSSLRRHSLLVENYVDNMDPV